MLNNSSQTNIQFSWQDILWRLALTALLLMVLAISSLTIFHSATTHPGTHVLPALTAYDTELAR